MRKRRLLAAGLRELIDAMALPDEPAAMFFERTPRSRRASTVGRAPPCQLLSITRAPSAPKDWAEPGQPVGDFTTNRRVIPISLLALVVGAVSAFVALALLRLIGLFTNLFFFQRWSTAAVSPAAHTLGAIAAVLVPVVGCLIIGFMARYGSERIRGHGIPEALEAILLRGSRIEPRVALLKPISAAISIGSGGPFGAEGPIIMTGGAFGSIVAQLFHLTAAERKTLLVAGAAGGMSATFASPVAAVVLAVELLLFELKPRSFIPVALASAMAATLRRFLLGAGPLFPVPALPAFAGAPALAGCVVVGLAAGMLSAGMTASVYAAEDFFTRLPIHWMWWPALGGLAVGLGGLACPQALGVGYDQIQALLLGSVPFRAVLLLAVVKLAIWAISLGSGTSGGVLAPLLMLGAALGALLSPVLPAVSPGFWPLICMGAILAGTMRAPLTAMVFALELTGEMGTLLPLLAAGAAAHGVHRAGAAAIDPDREDGAPGLPRQPRVRDRRARDPVRARRDALDGRSTAGGGDRRPR